MSRTTPSLTKCNREGCANLTANTFCGVACRRLASIGRKIASPHRAESAWHSQHGEGADATTCVTRAEYRQLAVTHPAVDSAGRRAWLTAKRRREEAQARREKRRRMRGQ